MTQLDEQDVQILEMMGNHEYAKIAMDRGWRLVSYTSWGDGGITDLSVSNSKYSGSYEYKTNGYPDDDTVEGLATSFLLCSLDWEIEILTKQIRERVGNALLSNSPVLISVESEGQKGIIQELKSLMDKVLANRKQRWEGLT